MMLHHVYRGLYSLTLCSIMFLNPSTAYHLPSDLSLFVPVRDLASILYCAAINLDQRADTSPLLDPEIVHHAGSY